MKIFLLTVVAVTIGSPSMAQPATCGEYDSAGEQALEYASRGLLDPALVLLERASQCFVDAGLREKAVELALGAASLWREQGATDRYRDYMAKAATYARGTRLQAAIELQDRLVGVSDPRDTREVVEALEVVGTVVAGLGDLDGILRTNLESNALTIREEIQVQAARAIGQVAADASAGELDEIEQRILSTLLSDDLSRRPSAVTPDLRELNRRRPWSAALLEVALRINDRVARVDRRYANSRLRKLEAAKDVSDRGTILGELGRFDDAIALKRQALAVFDDDDNFVNSVHALDSLCDLFIRKHDAVSALRHSLDLVSRIESQTFVQVGQTVSQFLDGYSTVYRRHSALLWAQYQVLQRAHDAQADAALNAFLIHADRFNFRPLRRDMALYQTLGDRIGSDAEGMARLNRSLEAVVDQQRRVNDAVLAGLRPENVDDSRQENPFAGADAARSSFVKALEDVKRRELRNTADDPTVARSMSEVTRDMGEKDAILFYFTAPSGQPFAALITRSRSEIVELEPDFEERVEALRDEFQSNVRLSTASVTFELSNLLLAPLPPMPERLTIVLNAQLLGIPFEVLSQKPLSPLIRSHQVRYVFGLYRAAAAPFDGKPVRRALVTGADHFEDPSLGRLVQSRQEVEGIRDLLRKRGADIAPADALPPLGAPLAAQADSVDVLHISTHSRLDSSLPILDALVFPKDRVLAHQFAMSPLRAAVVVLSACELYAPRDDRLYPVSGIATAALARMAPQVVSSLWQVNAVATHIFMLRFYSALAEDGDVAGALAVTKRDFADGRLAAWLTEQGVQHVDDLDLSRYRSYYFWAGFVVVAGVRSGS